MHWYVMQDGVARRYRQLTKDGKERKRINVDKALADGAVPSVTTVLKFVGESQGLVYWAVKETVYSTFDSILDALGESAKVKRGELVQQCIENAHEALEVAANIGTAMHKFIDAFISDRELPEVPPEIRDSCEVAAEAARKIVDAIQDRRTEHCLIGEIELRDGTLFRYGGTADLISPNVLLDWKTVGDDGRNAKLHECAQLVALRNAGAQMGLCLPDAELRNVYIRRTDGAVDNIVTWSQEDQSLGLDLFRLAAEAFRLLVIIARGRK